MKDARSVSLYPYYKLSVKHFAKSRIIYILNLSSETYSRKYEKLQNAVIHAG